MDLLHSFADANIEQSVLVLAGVGSQGGELEAESARLGITQRVHFLGFVNPCLLGRWQRGDFRL